MANIEIKSKAYTTETYKKFVTTDFKTFLPPAEEENTDTVEELFRLYDKLYYIIPVDGEVNSHKYLLQKSSELTDFDKSTEEIQPLLDEIAQLRAQLLNANEQIFELQKEQLDG